jgi:hypothetical protein
MFRSRGVALLALVLASLALPSSADPLDEITRMEPGRMNRASSGLYDPESNLDCHHVYPGQRLVIADLEGPGEIRHMWFTLASADRRYPRTVVLRIYWDGSEIPAVESPIGDLFAAGNGMRANVESIPVSVSSYGRALNCYWRMPFRKRAVVELANEGQETVSAYFQCEWLALDKEPTDALYFHARYKQEYPAKPLSPYVIFEGRGEGQYVGTVYSSQNMVGSWFGESDDRFFIDEESQPSIVGTGTEDYFNDAWNLRTHTYGRIGVSICDTKGDEERITAYRWHIDAPVPFHKSLRVEIERRSYISITDPETRKATQYDFKYRPDYVSSVAFWYHRGTMERTWDFAPAAERVLPEIWVEPKDLVDKARASEGLKPKRASNRTCAGKQFFYVRNDAPGGWVELPFEVKDPGRYVVSVFQSLFHEYGVWKVSLIGPEGETVLDSGLDFYDYLLPREENWPENYHHGTTVETKLGETHLAPGSYVVRFECVGANPLTRHPETGEFGKGYSLALDAICLRRLALEPSAWLADYLPAEEKLFAAMVDEATQEVGALVEAAEEARERAGHYPADLAGLYAERGMSAEEHLDPWGQPYQYRCPGIVHPWGVDVFSWHGNARDADTWIGNWETPYRVADDAPPSATVLEGEDLQVLRTADGVQATPQKAGSSLGGPRSGGGLLLVRSEITDGWAEIGLPDSVPAGEYDAYVLAGTSWDYGIGQWSLAGTKIGQPVDAYSERVGLACVGPARVTLGDGRRVLRVDLVGKNGQSAGCSAGLDALVLVPVRR